MLRDAEIDTVAKIMEGHAHGACYARGVQLALIYAEQKHVYYCA